MRTTSVFALGLAAAGAGMGAPLSASRRAIDLGGLLSMNIDPSPTDLPVISVPPVDLPALASSVESVVTGAIPTATPTLPSVQDTVNQLVSAALAAIPTGLLDSVPEFASLLSQASAALPTPTSALAPGPGPVQAQLNIGGIQAGLPPSPVSPAPAPTPTPPQPMLNDAMSVVTSVVDGVTSLLTLPSLPVPLPTGILSGVNIPSINIPGIMGDGSSPGPCIKNDKGDMVGFCDGDLLPEIKDTEQINL